MPRPLGSGLCLALALSGCAMGPRDTDWHAALPPAPGGGAPVTPVAGQAFAIGAATPREWWKEFASSDLDALVAAALQGSEDVRAADAALRQAQELAKAARGALGPQVDAGYQVQRAQTANSLSPPTADSSQLLYTLHTAQVTVSYPVDVFGVLSSKARSARAIAEVQRAHLLAARQSVAANLVSAVVTRAALDDQIVATRAVVSGARETLTMLQARERLGAAGDADVAAQEAALAAVEGTLPWLVRAEAHQRALIAILLGRAPGSELPALPALQALTLPARVPVSLPADVVRNRPDVIAAAAAVQGAAADVNSAVAARFPLLALSAGGGGAAQSFSDMFKDGNLFWSVIGSVTAPIFHMGQLRHQRRAAEAAFDSAKAQYRATVLQAFAGVSDALTGLHGDAEALDAAQRGAAAANRSLIYARRQLALGDIGALALVGAQASAQQARIQLAQARAARLVDTVALFQANGAAAN